LRRWDIGLIPSERSLDAVGEAVRLQIIDRSKIFDLFPNTDGPEKIAFLNAKSQTSRNIILTSHPAVWYVSNIKERE